LQRLIHILRLDAQDDCLSPLCYLSIGSSHDKSVLVGDKDDPLRPDVADQHLVTGVNIRGDYALYQGFSHVAGADKTDRAHLIRSKTSPVLLRILSFDTFAIAYYNVSMISEQDKAAIVQLARRFRVEKVFLFGSAADSQKESADIDLAVQGIRPEQFFDFYGELILALSKPVDLIDLSQNTKFNVLVKREAVALYG
jgi:predicted nucleotidyltransferase